MTPVAVEREGIIYSHTCRYQNTPNHTTYLFKKFLATVDASLSILSVAGMIPGFPAPLNRDLKLVVIR
jgi:hypothetical protein